jgi:hypothetical protein
MSSIDAVISRENRASLHELLRNNPDGTVWMICSNGSLMSVSKIGARCGAALGMKKHNIHLVVHQMLSILSSSIDFTE